MSFSGFKNGAIYSANTELSTIFNTVGSRVQSQTGGTYQFVEYALGAWDMTSTGSITIAHGLSATEWQTIKGLDCVVTNDGPSFTYQSLFYNNSTTFGGNYNFTDTNIVLIRIGGVLGFYDSINYNDTSINRGFVSFFYKPD